MKNFEKYERSYFMPPVPCYDWVKKDHIEKPPVWCSVDLHTKEKVKAKQYKLMF